MTRTEAEARLPSLLAELREAHEALGLLDGRSNRRKLTLEQVRDVRRRVCWDGMAYAAAGKLYGINAATVRDIVDGRTYQEAEAWPEDTA